MAGESGAGLAAGNAGTPLWFGEPAVACRATHREEM